jgi:hypothetical protein
MRAASKSESPRLKRWNREHELFAPSSSAFRTFSLVVLLMYTWLSAGLEFHHNHEGLCANGQVTCASGSHESHAHSGQEVNSSEVNSSEIESSIDLPAPDLCVIAPSKPDTSPCPVDLFTRIHGDSPVASLHQIIFICASHELLEPIHPHDYRPALLLRSRAPPVA